ncbi:MAG: FG-GAP repeat domain-containing protein [Myxococcaceae bacterium]
MAPPLHRLALVACLALLSCRDDSTRHRQEPPPDPFCGDGLVGEGEECDGSDLAGASCTTLGFDTGSLACDGACKFLTLSCVKRCGNGVLDTGEACDGTLGPLSCPSFGYKACGPACAVDSSHCVTDPFSAAPALSLDKGGPGFITDISPKGYGDLVVSNPNFLRLETFPYTVAQGFVPGRKVASGGSPVLPIAADLDGDGEADLAAIGADGRVERFRYLPASNTFPGEPYAQADAGVPCPAFAWVGVAGLDGDAAKDLVALACPSGAPAKANAFLVFRGGATAAAPTLLLQPGVVAAALGDADSDGLADLLFADDAALPALHTLRSTPPGFTAQSELTLPFTPSAFAAGDLDGDGRLDLLAVDGAFMKVLENTGAGFAGHGSYAAGAPLGLRIIDVDGDSRLDLVWLEGGKLEVRRNAGAFSFTAFQATTGAGAPLSLSVGDVDGDGDPDFAATCSAGGDATVTYVLLNKVR